MLLVLIQHDTTARLHLLPPLSSQLHVPEKSSKVRVGLCSNACINRSAPEAPCHTKQCMALADQLVDCEWAGGWMDC